MAKNHSHNAGPATIAGEILMTRQDAAARLRVSIVTIIRMQQRGLLHPRLIGSRMIRYRAAEVESIARGL